MKRVIVSLFLLVLFFDISAQKPRGKTPVIGIVTDLSNDSLLHQLGYRTMVESAAKLFSPRTVDDELFKKYLNTINTLQLELSAVNIFLPGDLKVVGPEVREDVILEFASAVLTRCKLAGVKMLVWGSGGSRRLPDGFSRQEAQHQFISIARKIADLGAEKNVLIVLENLNSSETNFITTVGEAYDIVRKVNHKNFRLCVDIYHMLKENESPDVILKTKKYLVHCDIAEKEGRRPPGVNNGNFIPFLQALKKIGYRKRIIIESQWKNFTEEARYARIYLQRQIDLVYD